MFCNCSRKTTSLILRRKLGDLLTGGGGGGQPVSSQYSLTDHKKSSDVPLLNQHLYYSSQNIFRKLADKLVRIFMCFKRNSHAERCWHDWFDQEDMK